MAASWALTVTHLGMLEDRRTLGPANILTLVRANLPAVEDRLGPLLPIAALATDFLDGQISRATGTQTPFGRDADFIADAAVWNWHAAQHEPSALLRLAAAVVWAGPIAAVVVSSFAGAGMKDVPRSPWIRPAAALQVVLAARALLRPAIAARRDTAEMRQRHGLDRLLQYGKGREGMTRPKRSG